MEIIVAAIFLALVVLVFRSYKPKAPAVVEIAPVVDDPVVDVPVAETPAVDAPVADVVLVKKPRKPRTPKTPAVVKKVPAKKAIAKSTAKITAGRKPKSK